MKRTCHLLRYFLGVHTLMALAYCHLASDALAQNISATTVQLPTFGVTVDAQGVLKHQALEDPTGNLHKERLAAAQSALPKDVQTPSKLRKVSLIRLEKALRQKLDTGQKPDVSMLYLAGLQRLQYVFFYPDTNDLVIAGPAEGWAVDLTGRVRGMNSGLPVLELEDLATAMRMYAPGAKPTPAFGCSIDPTPAGLAKMQEFQRTIPRTVRNEQRQEVAQYVATGLQTSLGLANIRVFGVPADTHFANVLVEADYRMKLIGMGLETPPVSIPSYVDLLSGSPGRGSLQRWWFVPNYECVKLTADRLGMELVGHFVQLLGEDKLIDAQGGLAAGTPANKASSLFTLAFTRKYPDLSSRSPVYAQMHNLFDISIAAAYMQQEKLHDKVGWNLGVLGDETLLPVRNRPAPAQVECAVRAFWKGSLLLAPAGGGVTAEPHKALAADQLIEDSGQKIHLLRTQLTIPPQNETWWWD